MTPAPKHTPTPQDKADDFMKHDHDEATELYLVQESEKRIFDEYFKHTEKMDAAESLGRQAGIKYDSDFRRLYMSENGTTPLKEPKNPFSKKTDEHLLWWRGYRETAYKWLFE